MRHSRVRADRERWSFFELALTQAAIKGRITTTWMLMPEDAVIPSGCLTDDVLLALLERRLSPETVSSIHHHAAGCAPCLDLLVEVARGDPPSGETDTVPFPEAARLSSLVPSSRFASDAWTPPAAFDEFRLVRMLGRGGMGVVYLARDTSLDRLVAIKFIAAGQPSEVARTHFATEARAIARLKHPNVVTVHRVGEIEGHPYLVSEYVIGQRLAEVACPMPWRRALGIGRGLARGLGAAHRQGVLHRDIKPGNVILASDGEVKLLDFGLAELVDDEGDTARAESHAIAGTPRYMAPEVLLGAAATPQSDMYSLGLVLYELCTGHVPQRGRLLLGPSEHMRTGDGADEAMAHRGQDSPLPEAVPGIDPDFAALVERCLRSDPTERFASVEILHEELERLDRPVAAQPLPAGNPYRGLHAFEAEHRTLFFGRDSDIRAVLERLRRESLLLIAGDSGAGKSSLCRAGVLPRVAEGVLDEQREFSVITLWPGRHPLEALAAAVAPVLGQKEAAVGAALAAADADVAWLGQELRQIHRTARGILLFVDQLEELLTLSPPAEAARFAEILAELALPAPGVRVLLAVRGDFLTRLASFPGLGEDLQRALYLLRPLSPEGMREAILGPARNLEVVFESEALIATLMESAVGGAGSLPLLQFALAELWERRDKVRGRITRAALEAMGGVAGALSRHANEVLARLSSAECQTARRVLVRLVTGEGTRIARSEAELGIADDDARAATRALVEGRLLYAMPSNEGPTYQIAHEALIESWGTLRNWLDEDIGHRAIRQRIEAAGAEWERLGRSSEALWSARQLDEALPLDPAALGPCERAFLAASHRAVRRRRYLGWLATLAAPLLVGAIYGGVRLQTHRASERFIASLMSTAQAALAESRMYGAKVIERRKEAMALFDGQARSEPAGSIGSTWEEAERVWTEALAEMEQADAVYTRADQALATALLRDSSHQDVRQLLAELTYERILLAEHFYQPRQRAELVRLIERLDEDHQWRGRLMAPAELSVETTPPGARVTLMRYVQDGGSRRLESMPGLSELGTTPMTQVRLPPGSYLLKFTLPGRAPVQLPVLLDRGERRQVQVPLPASVPEGYVYVPPGCFQFGFGGSEDQRKFLHTPPLHRVCMGQDKGYVIGRTEVTVGEWLAYLKALPENAPARQLFAEPRFMEAGMIRLRHERGVGWTYSFSVSHDRAAWPPERREGEPFAYAGRSRRASQDWRRFPMSGVSLEDIQGYLDWLDHSGRLPGARLCNEDEWERAARGADDRRYPHGDRLLPDEANIDETYGWKAFGPDVVGAHPASVSPFGLWDMSGNAIELTHSIPSEPGRLMMRGGAWYYDAGVGALIFNRTPIEPKVHDVRVGFRICAPFSAR